MTSKPKKTKTTADKTAKAVKDKKEKSAKVTDGAAVENEAPSHLDEYLRETGVDQQTKSYGPFAGVLITILIFVGLIAGAGVSREVWWPYFEDMLPRSSFESDPRVALLQDRVKELETNQQIKDATSKQEMAAFQDLEKERTRISLALAVALDRLESVEQSVKNVEKMAVAVSSNKASDQAKSAIAELSIRLNAMESQSKTGDGIGTGVNGEVLANISKRVEELETVNMETSQHSGMDTVYSDNIVQASTLVLAVGQLRSVVREGRAYNAEMAAVLANIETSPGIDVSHALDVLSSRATLGVKQMNALRVSFESAILQAVRAESKTEDSGDGADNGNNTGWVNDVLNKLKGLVSIRKIDGLTGITTVDARISRAQSSMSAGDLITVIGVIEALDGPAVDAFANWLQDAQTFVAIEKALDDLYGHVIGKLTNVQGQNQDQG